MDDFEQQLAALLPRLRRFARALTHQAADADDLVQLSLERALNARARWQPGTRLDAWMYRIMKNAWIDETRLRSRRARVNAPAEAGEQVGYDARPAIEARIDIGHVSRAMEALPAEQRLAVALVLVDGMSYKEAADVLEVPMGTLTSRLVRGRQTLMAKLGEPA